MPPKTFFRWGCNNGKKNWQNFVDGIDSCLAINDLIYIRADTRDGAGVVFLS
jgi:hypothetical protein